MKFKSPVYTQASGSIGGLVYSHNSGGMYTRGRGLVTNPSTNAQQIARNSLASLSAAWKALTQIQRDAFAVYALNSPVTNKLGDPLILSGQQMFVRLNTPRLVAGLTSITTAPTTFGMTSLSPSVATITAGATASLSLTITPGDTWASATGGRLFCFASEQMSPAINFFKGPFFWVNATSGSGTPLTSPLTISIVNTNNGALAVPITAGNRMYIRLLAQAADGRLSQEQIISDLAA